MSAIDQGWVREVGRVFNTNPRDGTYENTIWLARRRLEKDLQRNLATQGRHVCIDGPTGTGKSSLARTTISQLALRHVAVQVTGNLTWETFSSELTRCAPQDGTVAPAHYFRLRRALDESQVSDPTRWGEHDVARTLHQQQLSLYIDDLERATQNLIGRVADLAKLLTQSYEHPDVKLIIVGTDDIYSRLLTTNPALEDRLYQITVGTFGKPYQSRTFLTEGFNKLHLTHPWKDDLVSKDKAQSCTNFIYEAADGLPKSLNDLGSQIAADRPQRRRRISPHDIETHSKRMLRRHLDEGINRFPTVMNVVRERVENRLILEELYTQGIGQPFEVHKLVSTLEGKLGEEPIMMALQDLRDHGLITLTGRTGNVIYVRDPTFVHTLGVAVSNPERHGLRPELFEPMGQLSLPFYRKSGS